MSESDQGRMRAEVLHGLRKAQKELPSKYLYDAQGSQIFDRITSLKDYYPTRVEASIMSSHIDEIVDAIGPDVMLIDYGSGNSAKARRLLERLERPTAYVPIDISREHLMAAADGLRTDFPNIEILPVAADYTRSFDLPEPLSEPRRRVAFFPGSTIGNFEPLLAERFLERIADTCGSGGGLVIGADLAKEPAALHRAYNDADGVTAEFNCNILDHVNRELDADFACEQFVHYAPYNPTERRVEMHLVSLTDQTAHIDGTAIAFETGESIWTESSYKYTRRAFEELAAAAGFEPQRAWLDAKSWFGVFYLTVP